VALGNYGLMGFLDQPLQLKMRWLPRYKQVLAMEGCDLYVVALCAFGPSARRDLGLLIVSMAYSSRARGAQVSTHTRKPAVALQGLHLILMA